MPLLYEQPTAGGSYDNDIIPHTRAGPADSSGGQVTVHVPQIRCSDTSR